MAQLSPLRTHFVPSQMFSRVKPVDIKPDSSSTIAKTPIAMPSSRNITWMFCSLQQRSHHDNSALQKTLVHLQFDFGVVNTMDNDCKQQVLSVTLHLQQLTTLAVRPQTNTQTDRHTSPRTACWYCHHRKRAKKWRPLRPIVSEITTAIQSQTLTSTWQ